jgi:thiamine-phosphate pyrophosphorylase
VATLHGWLEGVRRADVDAVQLRCKGRGDREILAIAARAVARLSDGTPVLINGRPDLCLLAGATGVHLPAAGLPVSAVRRVLGRPALVGRSTHSIDEIRTAMEEGADYVTFGPVYATPGKDIYGRPQGLERLGQAAEVGLPVLALGGITRMERIRECVAAGAWGVAGIRLFGKPTLAGDCVAALREDPVHL